MMMADHIENGVGFLSRAFDEFCGDEEGATVIEYGLIVSLIFLAIVASVRSFTGSTSDMYEEISSTLAG